MSKYSQTVIQPIEDLMFSGFQSRFQQVFDCPVIYTTATDKAKLIKRMFEGKEISYPYAFITIQSISPNTDSYNSNSLARNGLVTVSQNNIAYRVRLIPAKFELEIEYVTNKFQGLDAGSVLTFAKRWLFARKNGYLKFNINYGRLAIGISAILSNTANTPLRDNVLEAESVYTITNTLSLNGYISEPVLGTIGVIQDIEVNEVSIDINGAVPNFQFHSFNR